MCIRDRRCILPTANALMMTMANLPLAPPWDAALTNLRLDSSGCIAAGRGSCAHTEFSQSPSRSTSSPVGLVMHNIAPVSYTHLRAHETVLDLVCRLLLEKKKKNHNPAGNKNNLTLIKKYIRNQTITMILIED
eukprot:TRINITY_DN14875_c0_g1_i1.p1 TRINITY_DN14875_c0_g1~~TRINITY_DN14875_c0_g1_i1.p1  ORF type:complete len:134 (+),score=25.29 TRINITY_DN14875_c0_g1_i1:113-514(+)